MKTAIYLDEGDTQVVLRAENVWEEKILQMVHDTLPDKSYWGEFYACVGGWIRQKSGWGQYDASENSLIIRIQKPAPIKEIEP